MLKRSLLALSLVLLPLQPAYADWDRHDHGRRGGWDRHDRHDYYPRGHRHVVSFNFGIAPYYSSYYRPTRVIYAPRPVVVQQPEVIYINNDNSRVVDNNDGRYCREYQSNVRVGGVLRESYGTACQQPDGSWEIIS